MKWLVLTALALLAGNPSALGTADVVKEAHLGSLQEGELQKLLDQLRKDAGAPGAILGIASGDGHLKVVASGQADREAGRPMAPDTPYFLGSITKTYTAVVILRLAEEGRLSLDDPIARFLPAFPEGSKITIRHLLTHTSGLKDFYSHFYYRPDREEMIRLVTKRWTEEELLELSGRFGRWFDPGTDWDYSNTGYYLLGVIIERASGLALTEAYRRYIYEPLGLRRTWLAQHEEARGPLPVGYMGPVEGWKHSEMFGGKRIHSCVGPVFGGAERGRPGGPGGGEPSIPPRAFYREAPGPRVAGSHAGVSCHALSRPVQQERGASQQI